jgi:hypothetical protein
MKQIRNKAPRPGQSDLSGSMAVPYPAQNPPGAQQDPNLGNVAGPGSKALTVNNPGGRIEPYPPQGFGKIEEIDHSDEQGITYLSNFGNYYRVPRYTTQIIRKYQDNVYSAGIYHSQRHQLFREKYKLIITDDAGETDTDECTAIMNDMVKMLDAVMVQPHTYGLQAAIEMSWADTFWFGIGLFNPVWDWDENVYTLQKLRHLPAESFGTQPYGRPFLYSDIMQGIVISPYDGSVEYFQTLYMPQNNAPPGPVVSTQFLQTKLTNIVTIKDPSFPDLAGRPVMLPIFPLIAMLDFTWQAQVQRVNRIGAPVLFLKIINPQGNDIEYGQLLLQNWGKNSAFQLRANFELVKPELSDSGSALETIAALDKLIIQYFNPASTLQRSSATPMSGSSNSEKEMVDDYTRNVHAWLEDQWSHILQEYLDVNGYEGYTVMLDIPDPSIDRSTIELQQSIAGAADGSMTTNEIRKKRGEDELDEAGLAALREDVLARKPAIPAFGGGFPAGNENPPEPTPEEKETGAVPSQLMQKAKLALDAAKADELDPSAYVDKEKVSKIVNAALDETAFPKNEKDKTENIGGSGITQAAFWPNSGEVPQDVQKILTNAYSWAWDSSEYPEDSADRDLDAKKFAWDAVAKAGWKKTEAGWVQTGKGPYPKGGIQ